jgi:sugar phosphate isomerase/epimerase
MRWTCRPSSAADRLYFTHPDAAVREAAVERIAGMFRLAADVGAKVRTGRIRGFIHEGETVRTATGRYPECLGRCADAAAPDERA